MQKSETVDQYIQQFDPEVQEKLKLLRSLISEIAPEAVASISYGMPAYKLNKKPLAYFAGYARHIGFYATPNSHEAFHVQLAGYKTGKGSVQFPLGEPLPLDLIRSMLAFRRDTILLKKA